MRRHRLSRLIRRSPTRFRIHEEKHMDDRDDTADRIARNQRTKKKQARQQGIGTPEPGMDLPAHSYPDQTAMVDLGVDDPALAAQPIEPKPDADPTGMFAGETEADRQDEDAVRRELEERFPATKGTWKEGGRVST